MSTTEHMQKAVSVCALTERKKTQQYFKVLSLELFQARKIATSVQRLFEHRCPLTELQVAVCTPLLPTELPFASGNAADTPLWLFPTDVRRGLRYEQGSVSCIFLV